MTARIEGDSGESEDVAEDAELTDEELQHVVGGLDRGWWPDPDEPAGPKTDF
jgi:bacteriocin-like protein